MMSIVLHRQEAISGSKPRPTFKNRCPQPAVGQALKSTDSAQKLISNVALRARKTGSEDA